jgi:hypothetical protein
MALRLSLPRIADIGRFLLGGILALLVVEVGLRVIEATPLWRILPVVQPIPGQPDKDFGFESTPGARGIWTTEHRARLQINSLGLRDVERELAKPAGTLRVGLLGDSMVEGAQVSQEANFGALAERRLRAEGYKVELINLAIAGPSPIRQLWRLERRGYPLNLDLVLANSAAGSFLSGALLDDSENPAYVPTANGQLTLGYGFRQRLSHRHAEGLPGRLFVALYQSSPVVRMLYLRSKEPWSVLLGLPSVASAAQRPALAAPTPAADAARVACERATAALAPMIDLWGDHRPELLWAATARFLDDLAQSARSHGVRVVYAIRDIPLPPADCPAASVRADLLVHMQHEFTSRGIRLIDWSAAVAEVVGGAAHVPQLHGFGIHTGAGHLNYDGHRAWAIALIDVLRRELPLDAAARDSSQAIHPAAEQAPAHASPGNAAKP